MLEGSTLGTLVELMVRAEILAGSEGRLIPSRFEPDVDHRDLIVADVETPGTMRKLTEGDPAEWTWPPFGADLVDGRIYGRGAADMKSGLAAAMVALSHWSLMNLPTGFAWRTRSLYALMCGSR